MGEINIEKYFQMTVDFKGYLLESLIFYSPIISYLYDFIFYLLLILEKIKLEKKKDSNIFIKNFNIIKDLTTVSNVFLSKNSLIDSSKTQIHSLVLSENYVELNETELLKIKTYFNQKKEIMFPRIYFFFYFRIFKNF